MIHGNGCGQNIPAWYLDPLLPVWVTERSSGAAILGAFLKSMQITMCVQHIPHCWLCRPQSGTHQIPTTFCFGALWFANVTCKSISWECIMTKIVIKVSVLWRPTAGFYELFVCWKQWNLGVSFFYCSDEDVQQAAIFRSKGRLPHLCWQNPGKSFILGFWL